MRRWPNRWPACCAAWKKAIVRPGDTVAIIGLGPIGMMFVRLAKTVYEARVIAIGRRQPQLDRAARMGADELIVNNDGADVGQRGEEA